MSGLRYWVGLAVLGAVAFGAPGIAAAEGIGGPCVEGEVLVTFRDGGQDAAGRAAAIVSRHGAAAVRSFAAVSRATGRDVVLFRSARRTADLIQTLSADASVYAVDPNYVRRIGGDRPPSDPMFGSLWALRNTGQVVNASVGVAGADTAALQAWALLRQPANPVVVAVIDTGIDYRHPDLAGAMWRNPGEVPTNGVDDDFNGLIDDYYGYDFAGNIGAGGAPDADPFDAREHGTHVAGTLAAAVDNGVGVAGIAGGCARIMALKASADGTTLPDSTTLAAYDYALMMKARGVNIVAVNASYSGDGYSTAVRDAIAALGSAGIVFCAAAGNNSTNLDLSPTYPVCYDLLNLVAVAASDSSDARYALSNYGTGVVDIAAPGVNILSARPTNRPGYPAEVTQGTNRYAGSNLGYSGATTGITATLYPCGLGYATQFPAQVSGNVALIQRGILLYTQKVANAMAAGAVAVAIWNNTNGTFLGSLQNPGNWVPVVGITREAGAALLAAAPCRVTVSVPVATNEIYQFLSGTSMATPHAAGAVAVLAHSFPTDNVAQRVARLLDAGVAVAGLAATARGGRRLDLARALDRDADLLPDWWECDSLGGTNGAPGADPDGDGASNFNEWRAGTHPSNAASVLSCAVSTGGVAGIAVAWPSATNRFYRIDRSEDIGAGFLGVVRSNIAATPPANCEPDGTATGRGPYFYRVVVE